MDVDNHTALDNGATRVIDMLHTVLGTEVPQLLGAKVKQVSAQNALLFLRNNCAVPSREDLAGLDLGFADIGMLRLGMRGPSPNVLVCVRTRGNEPMRGVPYIWDNTVDEWRRRAEGLPAGEREDVMDELAAVPVTARHQCLDYLSEATTWAVRLPAFCTHADRVGPADTRVIMNPEEPTCCLFGHGVFFSMAGDTYRFFDEWLRLASRIVPATNELDIAIFDMNDMPGDWRFRRVLAEAAAQPEPAQHLVGHNDTFQQFKRWFQGLPPAVRDAVVFDTHQMHWVSRCVLGVHVAVPLNAAGLAAAVNNPAALLPALNAPAVAAAVQNALNAAAAPAEPAAEPAAEP